MKRYYPAIFLAVALAVANLFGAPNQLRDSFAQSASVSAPTQQGPAVDLDFADGAYYQAGQNCTTIANCITTSRASSGTNLLPTSASGFAYATFGNNVARITAGSGLLVEEARTNQLLNSTAPATQTTGSLANATYTLWVNGSGTATMSAGTATGCGTGVALQGSPVNFTTSGAAGTCTVTVSGSLNTFQLEAGSFGTSLIVTAGVTATRAADAVALTNVPTLGTAISALVSFMPNAPSTYATDQVALHIDNGTASNRLYYSRGGNSTNAQFVYTVGGSSTVITNAGLTTGNTGKIAVASQAGDQSQVLNGGTASVAAGAGFPSGLANVRIGSNQGGQAQANGYISRVALWPTTRLPNAQLQNITNTNWAANDNLPGAANDNELLKLWAAR